MGLETELLTKMVTFGTKKNWTKDNTKTWTILMVFDTDNYKNV